jgi:hypothetical protein
MTQTDKEAVELLVALLEWPNPETVEGAAKMLLSLRATLDAAEAEKRAAVEAAYEKAAQKADYHLDRVKPHHPDEPGPDKVAYGYGNAALNIAVAIRALSDTDALAEYTEKVRAEERERCAKIADERALTLEAYATFGEKEREFLLMAKGARDAAKFIRETNDG